MLQESNFLLKTFTEFVFLERAIHLLFFFNKIIALNTKIDSIPKLLTVLRIAKNFFLESMIFFLVGHVADSLKAFSKCDIRNKELQENLVSCYAKTMKKKIVFLQDGNAFTGCV